MKSIFEILPEDIKIDLLKLEWGNVFKNDEKPDETELMNRLNVFEKLVNFCGDDPTLTMEVWYYITWLLIFKKNLDEETMKIVMLFSNLELPEHHAGDTYANIKKEILSLVSNKKKSLTIKI